MLKHKASIPGPQALKPLVLLLLALLFAGAVTGATLSLTRAQTANGVYDTDGDKLIEISYLEQLAAIGYDLDGDGEADNTVAAAFYSLAFPVEAGESVCDSDCTGYELAKSLDFKKAGSYSSGVINPFWTDALGGSGWVPIIHRAADGTKKGYAATFEGNGYTIANLYSKEALNDTDTGLFAILESGATVKNLGLTGVSVTGEYNDTGALVGNNKGAITGSHSTGTVKGKGDAGGLVGNNNGTVSKSYAAVAVTGENTSSSEKTYTGGLVGDNIGTISHSYATGAVAGKEKVVGGLAGYNIGTVTHSYASGPVSGKADDVGGLVGKNASKVTASFANGAVSGSEDNVGGLVGDNLGTVTVSYAAGAVSGTGNNVGGLAGANSGTVRSAYAVGDVSGKASVGGLIGNNTAKVEYSFAAYDDVTGDSSVGGLIGSNAASGTTVTDSYWDTTIGPSASASGVGKTTSELQTPTGYTGIYEDWDDGDEGSVWDFGTASQYPALKADLNDDGMATVGEFGSQRSSGGSAQTASSTLASPTPTPAPTATPTPTLAPPEGSPTGLSAARDGFTVSGSWNAVKFATSYDVELLKWTSGETTVEQTVTGVTALTASFKLSSVASFSDSHVVRVTAKNAGGSSESVDSSVVAPPDPPAMTESVTGARSFDDTGGLTVINVTWDAVEGATHYLLNYYVHDGSDEWHRHTNDITSTSFTMTGLQETMGYTLAVMAVKHYREGNLLVRHGHGWKNSGLVEAPAPPALTESVTGTRSADGKQITVSWVAVEGATQYSLNYYVEDDGNDEWFRYTDDIIGTSFTMTGLQPTRAYTVAIQSVTQYQGNGFTRSFADGWKNSDKIHAPPGKPTSVSTNKYGSASSPRVRVSWTIPGFRGTGPDSAADKISYNIYCRSNSGASWDKAASGLTSSSGSSNPSYTVLNNLTCWRYTGEVAVSATNVVEGEMGK